jgi:enolase-phosphatase E1
MQTAMNGISIVLLDVEGTTTPIDFVHRVLFSYAREHMEEFLKTQWQERSVRADVDLLRAYHRSDRENGQEPPEWHNGSDSSAQSSALSYILWMMDKDAKSTPLKSLQGKIWQQGYQNGELKAEVFPDVPRAFVRWSQLQKEICIFSSGSVLAQRLLFANTNHGDLSTFLKRHFDTEVGAKGDPESYRKIAAALGTDASCVLFMSDTLKEVEAARAAKMETAWCVRGPENPSSTGNHLLVRTFDNVLI